jgi:hypothetical protein
MSLLLPLGPRQQPQGALSINWANSVTRGLVFCWSATQQNDLISQRRPTYSGTRPTREYGAEGIAQRFSADGRIQFTRDSRLDLTSQVSALVITRPVANASAFTNFVFMKRADGFNNPAYGMSFGPSTGYAIGLDVYDPGGVFVGINFAAGQSTYAAPFVASGTVQSGSQKLFIDGVVKSTAASTYTSLAASASHDIYIGDYTTSVNPYNGSVGLVCVWNRSLTDSEHQSLGTNPWQIFAPARRLILVPIINISRPSSDITVTGWTGVPNNTNLYTNIDESPTNSSDYIISPGLTATPGPAIFGITPTLPAGDVDVRISANYAGSTGQIRVLLLDSGGATVGTSSWQALTTSIAQYTFSVTTTGTAARIRLEVQA